MVKRIKCPAVLPIDPVTLRCPFCGAERDKDCSTSKGGFAVLHVARIHAAAAQDAALADLKKRAEEARRRLEKLRRKAERLKCERKALSEDFS